MRTGHTTMLPPTCMQADGGAVSSGSRTLLKGVVARLSGSTGFQLINVANVPIMLEGQTANNLLVNKVGAWVR